jgi:cytochrome c2
MEFSRDNLLPPRSWYALQAMIGAAAAVSASAGPLLTKCDCCTTLTDIAKHADGPLLKGVLDAGDSQSHANTFKHVTDARQQLVELQELVGGNAKFSLSVAM